jgi:hypothetical protein
VASLAARDTEGSHGIDLLLISVVWLAAGLLLQPFQNTPFIDDWVYAWSVERLLNVGDLRVLDHSTSLNVIQILWGALFCVPAGFSFTALRVSTWVAGLLGLWGMYLALRDQSVNRGDALLGTACLGFYPIYFILSFTFMTDVPMVACSIWTILAFLRAMSRQSDRWLLIAIALACGVVGIRLVGVVLPVAMGLTLLMASGRWGLRKGRFVWPVVALLFYGLIMWWFGRHVEVVGDLSEIPSAPATRIRLLKQHGLQYLSGMSLSALNFLAGALGLALLPLSAGVMRRRLMWASLAVMAVLGVGMTMAWDFPQGHHPLLSLWGRMWSLGELGFTEPLVSGYDQPSENAWWTWMVWAVTLASSSILVAHSMRRVVAVDVFLLLQIVGHSTLIAVLWLQWDRYALPLLPVVIILVLRRRPIVRPRITVALVLAMGLISLIGVRDHLAYNRALWKAVEHLQAMGIKPADFDGGYVVNGWLQWAHPEHARRNAAGSAEVPWINVKATTPYLISNQATPPWQVNPPWEVVESFPYTRWAGRSGHVYVLKDPA